MCVGTQLAATPFEANNAVDDALALEWFRRLPIECRDRTVPPGGDLSHASTAPRVLARGCHTAVVRS